MIVATIYFSIAFLCIYPFSMIMLDQVLGNPPYDSFDRGMSIFIGFCASAFWPAILVGILAYRLSKKIWLRVVGEDDREKANR